MAKTAILEKVLYGSIQHLGKLGNCLSAHAVGESGCMKSEDGILTGCRGSIATLPQCQRQVLIHLPGSSDPNSPPPPAPPHLTCSPREHLMRGTAAFVVFASGKHSAHIKDKR